MSEPTQPPGTDNDTEALRETAARREVLAMYRRSREGGAVPLVAMADVRRVIADALAQTIIETGAISQFWLVRYRAAVDYSERLTARPWPLTP
jgi:hypothetical protein